MKKSRFKSLSFIICTLFVFLLPQIIIQPQQIMAQAVNSPSVSYQGPHVLANAP